MPDTQEPIAPPQQGPIVAPDLSASPGLIDNRPYQAPLPASNIPATFEGTDESTSQPKTIGQLFNTMRFEEDNKNYARPEYTPQQETNRYRTWNPYINNEEVAAQNQSWYSKWGNALVKTGITALGTFAQSLMTIPDSLKALGSGKLDDLYQSDTENKFDNWIKNSENQFPNYYSKWEQAHPFLSAIPFSGGAANFWSDKMVKNLGFTIGAIGGAVFQDMAVGALTQGIGEIPMLGNQIGKASLWLNKIFSTETDLGKFLGAINPGRLTTLTDAAEKAGASTQAIFDMAKLAEYAQTKKVLDAPRFAMNLYGAARTEGGFEARDGYNQVKQDLTEAFRIDNKREPDKNESGEIDKYATASANVRFGINLALLSVSDAINFDGILKPFDGARKGIRSTIQRELEEGGQIGLKAGSLDEFEKKVPETLRGKIWQRVKPSIPAVLSEGIYEEGGQYAAQVATQNYYERKYYNDKGISLDKYGDNTAWNAHDSIANILHSTGQGLSGEFGSDEGLENILLGGLTGVLTAGVEHYYDKIKGHTEKTLQATLATLNSSSLSGLVQQTYGNAVKSLSESKRMQDAAQHNDIFEYNNAGSRLFNNFILSSLQSDKFEVREEQLKLLKEIPQTTFETQFRQEDNPQNRKTVGEYVDALLEKAHQIKRNYDAINQTFENPFRFNKKAKTEEQNLTNEKYKNFEEWKATLLEHTSDIDDSDRRIKSIAQDITRINPAVTSQQVAELTHPKALRSMAASFTKEAEGAQKDLDDKLATGEDRKELQKRADSFRNRATLITDFLDSPSKGEERDNKFTKMFDSVLHFNANGQTEDNTVAIRKQNLPQLMQYGMDTNKLNARKAVAAKAYDILTSEEGFNKYFSALQDKTEKAAKEYDAEEAGVGVNPNDIIPPVQTKDGSEVFKPGQSYIIDQGTKEEPNIQNLTYTGADPDGNLLFKDEAGKEVSLDPAKISSFSEYTEKLGNEFTQTITTVGGGDVINNEGGQHDDDAKKPISVGIRAATDPRFEDTTPFNNFHRRHQTFLLNLGSTDPSVFNQDVKGTLKIYPVTAKTGEKLGFPKEFAQDLTGEDPTVRLVYVSLEGSDMHLLDAHGKKIQRLDGTPVDPSKVIFSTLADSKIEWKGGDRYTNKSNLDVEKLQAFQKTLRDKLLNSEAAQMPVYSFAVSRGLPNIKNFDAKNTVVNTGLVAEKDLHNLVITIPTIGSTAIAALLNDNGEGIASESEAVNMPLGVPLLNWGGNLVYLNNRKLGEGEVQNCFNLLKTLAQKALDNRGGKKGEVFDKAILGYLSRVLYFSQPQEGKSISPNQIWIDKKTGLHLGDKVMPFIPASLEAAKAQITSFLEGVYHNVNNYELNEGQKDKNRTFNELQVKDGKVEVAKTWPSYQHYLLTGQTPVLTTNVIEPKDDEIPIIQKYSVLQLPDFDTKNYISQKQVKPKQAALPSSTAPKKAKQAVAASIAPHNVISVRHGSTDEDKNKVMSGIDGPLLNKEGEQEALTLASNLIDEGASAIVTGAPERHRQTGDIVAGILGITPTVNDAFNPWNVGEFVGMKDADFTEAEKHFLNNPEDTKFTVSGKEYKLAESFGKFFKTFIEAREALEKDAKPGTVLITSSSNTRLWEAYVNNGKVWDEKAITYYLGDKGPANGKVDEKEGIEDGEYVYKLPDGSSIEYSVVSDKGGVQDVKLDRFVKKDGTEGNPPADIRNNARLAIMQGLNLSSAVPVQPETASKGSSALEKLKKHKGTATDSQYSTALPGSYKPIDITTEFNKAKSILPKWVTFKEVSDIIRKTGGGLAWGALQDATVYVYQNAKSGTTYHESFELVWQNFLSPKEQFSLFREFTSREGTFENFDGKTTEYGKSTFAEAKERIADEFADYIADKDLVIPEKQKSWFQRIIDWVKSIFLGKDDRITSLFKSIGDGGYANYPASQRNPSAIEYSSINASEAFIQDVLQGMTAELFAREFEKDSSILSAFEERGGEGSSAVYNRLFNSLQDFYTSDDEDRRDTLQSIYATKLKQSTNEGEGLQIGTEFEAVQNHWNFIKDNWKEFVEEHKEYLKVFKVKFDETSQGEINMTSSQRGKEDFDNMKGREDYTDDEMTMNVRNRASEKWKLLLATIADRKFIKQSVNASLEEIRARTGEKTQINRDNSQVKLPKLAPYAKLYNYLLHNVSNINGLYDIYQKIVEMSNNSKIKINAIVDALRLRLGFEHGFKGKTLDSAKLLLSAENALTKQKPDFVRQYVDDNGNVYSKTSIVSSRAEQIVDNWISGIKASGAVKTTAKNEFIFDPSVKGIADPLHFLDKIGIKITKEDWDSLRPADKTSFRDEVNALRAIIENNVGKKIPIISSRVLGIDGRLNNLANLYVDKIAGEDTESMHFSLDNNMTSNFILPNLISTIANDANASPNRQRFIDSNPQYNDIYMGSSLLLTKILFDEASGVSIKKVALAIPEGRESFNGDNAAASSLSEPERFIYEFNHNIQGIFYTLLPADAKTERAINSGLYIKANEYFDEVTRQNAIDGFHQTMYDNLKNEIALAKDYATNPFRQNIEELGKKYGNRVKGNSLRFFSDILDEDVVDTIHNRVIDGNEDIEKVLSLSVFGGAISDWINKTASTTLDYLVSNYVFSVNPNYKDSFKPNGILTDFLAKNLGNTTFHSRVQLEAMIAFREMNYVINNIEMHKFFFGDPAQYADEMKRIKSTLSGREWSHVDTLGTAEGFNQWANTSMNIHNGVQLTPKDPGYHNFKNEMNALTVRDINVQSQMIDLYNTQLGSKIAAPYSNLNEADAVTLQMPGSWRETQLKAGGRLTQRQEDAYKWESAWERQEKEKVGKYTYTSNELKEADKRLLDKQPSPDDKVYFPTSKPIHSGFQVKGNTAIVSLDKTAAVPMFYRWVKGRQLETLYNTLQAKGTDYVRVESAHKVGIQNDNIAPLYTEEGKVNVEGLNGLTHESIPYKYYGIQVDTSSRKDSQTEGTQLRVQAIGDLMNDGKPVDAPAGWDTMSEEDKRKASPVYNLVQQHEEVLSSLSNKRTDNLLKKLGVTETEDGFEYQDREKVRKFLTRELSRREMPKNIRDGLSINPATGNFNIPLEALSNYKMVRSILYSNIENSLIKPKVSGHPATQIPVTGWERENRVKVQTINGKSVYTSTLLKTYDKGKDGKTTQAEVMLPYWFGSKIRTVLEKRGKSFVDDAAFKAHILDYLNNTPGGKQLLSGIGFRIPCQGDNAVESFIVKEFLPEQMGDVVVLPSEVTAKAGSDFDIDKLNMYLRNFFINKEGYPEAIPFEDVDTSSDQALQDYYEKYMLEDRKEYQAWVAQASTRKLAAGMFGEDDEEEPEYVPTLAEFLDSSRGMSANDINSTKALENRYFDTLQQIYALPEKFKSLVTPNNADELKDISAKVGNTNEGPGLYGRAINSLWMMQERHKYLVGKGGVGIAASAQSNHYVNQLANTYLKLPKDFTLRLPHNTIDINGSRYVSLSSTLNVSGKRISSVVSQFIDGYVDIAKGAWVIDMGANDSLAGDFLLMVKWGTDPMDVGLFMNQPSIKAYTTEQQSRKSISQINKDVQQLTPSTLTNILRAKIAPGISIGKRPAMYTRGMMKEMAEKYKESGYTNFTDEERRLQMHMLDDYKKIVKMRWNLFNHMQGYNWDNSRINDPNEERRKSLQYREALTNPTISSVSRVLSGSYKGSVKANIQKVNTAIKALFNTQTGAAGRVMDTLADDFYKKRMKVDTFKAAMLKAEMSMIDYIVQTTGQIGGKTLNQWISRTLLSSIPVARYVKAMQESGDIKLVSNPILSNLRANLDEEGKPSTIELIEKDYESYTSNIWTDAFRELRDNNRTISIDDNPSHDRSVSQIFQNMVLTSILQSGVKQSAISFQHLLPVEEVSKRISDPLVNMTADLNQFYDQDAFYRSNWSDRNVVPIVPATYVEAAPSAEDAGSQIPKFMRIYPGLRTDSFLSFLEGRDIPRAMVPRSLKLNAFNWSKHRVVQTVDYIKDTSGNIISKEVHLFKRVDILGEEGKDPLVIVDRRELMKKEAGDDNADTTRYAVYKEINKWGAGDKTQEYYNDRIASALDGNPAIFEVPDDLFALALNKSPYATNVDDFTLSRIIDEFGQEEAEEGEAATAPTSPDKPQTPPKMVVNMEGWKRIQAQETFRAAEGGEIVEVKGNRIVVPSSPDFKSFTYKGKDGKFHWVEETTLKPLSYMGGKTIKEAVEEGVRIIKAVLQQGKTESLKNINITLTEEDKDSMQKGC